MRLMLLSRPDCHLCHIVAGHLRDLGFQFDTIDVDSDPALAERYGGAIPVVLNGEAEVARMPMSRGSLRQALAAQSKNGG